MTMKTKILYYITSHGYGHAVRSAAVCNALGKFARDTNRDIHITIKSGVPRNFFEEELTVAHTVIDNVYDVGCLQDDAVSVRVRDTLAAYDDVANRNREILSQEVKWCVDNNIDCIVSDIVPFAFDVADKANIPSVAISNFTWHDIYEPYIKKFSEYKSIYQSMLDDMARQYQKATRVLALDPAMSMNVFDDRKKIKIPPVGKEGVNKKNEIYKTFNINPKKYLGLIYVGNFGLNDICYNRLEQLDKWEFVGIYPIDNAPKNYHYVTKDKFSYQDLHASADAIICKLGYGVFSASQLFGVPLIYLARKDFAEYQTLDEAVKKIDCGITIDNDTFKNLSLQNALNYALEKKFRQTENIGAKLCAKSIFDLMV